MKGTHVYSNTGVALEVVPSSLVSSIRDGVYRHMNRLDINVLDGSNSKDPDGGIYRYLYVPLFYDRMELNCVQRLT